MKIKIKKKPAALAHVKLQSYFLFATGTSVELYKKFLIKKLSRIMKRILEPIISNFESEKKKKKFKRKNTRAVIHINF